MKHLKLSRRELDEMKAVMGRDDRFRALFDHIAAVEAEKEKLERALYWAERELQEYGAEVPEEVES